MKSLTNGFVFAWFGTFSVAQKDYALLYQQLRISNVHAEWFDLPRTHDDDDKLVSRRRLFFFLLLLLTKPFSTHCSSSNKQFLLQKSTSWGILQMSRLMWKGTIALCSLRSLMWAGPWENVSCLISYANNKGADQPADPRCLISAFVNRCLDSIISLDSIAEISRL